MPEREGHLVVAIPFDAQAFNEVYRNYTGAGGYFAANNIYSRLVVLDVFESGDIHPDLAKSWDILDSGQTYVFHLDRDARWHDGVAVTAADVAYTYSEVLEHGYHGLSWLQDIDTIRALDDHTVECRLKSPNAAFLAQLGAFVFTHVLPKHLYEGTDWATNPHNLNPVGSGPFKFERWEPGDRIELVANEKYWREGPYLERITYRVTPDREAGFAAIESGDAHFFVQDVPCKEVDQFKQKPGVDVMFHPGNAIAFVAFNWQRPAFQDHRVREAIARAIDRKPIAEQVCPLASTPEHYYLERVDWAFNPNAKAPEYDVGRANQLLDEAGYVREADGTRMRIGLAYRSLYSHYGVAGHIIADQLKRIGIDATVEPVDPVGWKERFQDEGDFDLLLDSGDIGPDPQLMSIFLASDGPRNSMRYRNETVDRAFKEGRATVNRDERGKHYRVLQDALAADIARVPFMQHGEHLPYRTEFTGWSWSDGVRGTAPFWHHGLVRKA
ncbi:MAG TPA: ABC transporter substrate-binding protein [Thermomicrobiales bacterium]|nr:ABC transporter substrate-binding protein [Thermomicrobiales bacterium]